MKKYKKTIIGLTIIASVILLVLLIRCINGIYYKDINISNNFEDFADMSTYILEYDDLTVSEIKHSSLNGFHIKPNNKTKDGLIVTFGGSEGGCDYDTALWLGTQGYEVISLFYFGQENQSSLAHKVPLEFFEDFLIYTNDNKIDTSILTVIGTSKGAELALLLTNYYTEIDNVVLYAPSAYVFQGADMAEEGSTWTYEGEDIPYIYTGMISQTAPAMISSTVFNYPTSFREHFLISMEKDENMEETKIDILDFSGNILAFAGADDMIWHADIMAREIQDTLPNQTEIFIYPNVGHMFLPLTYFFGMDNGGNIEANEEAKELSNTELLKFLESYHRK